MIGLSEREIAMLVTMVFVAMFTSVLNYIWTKKMLRRDLIPRKLLKPIMIGAVAGLILWCITNSGDVRHETGILMAISFGYFSEKIVAHYVNRNAGVPLIVTETEPLPTKVGPFDLVDKAVKKKIKKSKK